MKSIEEYTYDFNIILSKIGEFGWFQKLLVLIAFFATIPGSSNISAGVYLSFEEPTRCLLPTDLSHEASRGNESFNNILMLYLPIDRTTETYSPCSKYKTAHCEENVTSCIESLHEAGLLTEDNITSCDDGYWHARKIFEQTTRTEWNLICEDRNLNTLSTSLFCLGMLVGAIFGGVLSDRFGRKKTWFVSTLLAGIFGSVCSLSPNIYIFVTLRFMVGACVSSILLCISVHTMEFVGDVHRPLVGLQVGIFSGLGYMNLAFVAYFFRHWRKLQLVLGLSFFPFLFIIPFIPESPRYLLRSGNVARGQKVCRQMAKLNGVEIDETIWEKAKVYREKKEQTYSPRILFTRWPLLKMLIICFILNFMSSLVFFFLSFNVGAWFGDPFLNQFLSGLVELVACLIAIPAAMSLGRRVINVTCLSIAGGLLISTEALKFAFPGQLWVKSAEVFILLVAKLAASPSFNLLFLYVAELFPTSLRSTASGIANTGSRFASVLSPLMISMPKSFQPFVTLSTFAVVATTSSMGKLINHN